MPKSKVSKSKASSLKGQIFRPWIITTICLIAFLQLLGVSLFLWALLSPMVILGGIKSFSLIPILLLPFLVLYFLVALWKMKKWVFMFYMISFVIGVIRIFTHTGTYGDVLATGIISIVGLIKWNQLT